VLTHDSSNTGPTGFELPLVPVPHTIPLWKGGRLSLPREVAIAGETMHWMLDKVSSYGGIVELDGTVTTIAGGAPVFPETRIKSCLDLETHNRR
jgi:hypothetical protein